MRCKVGDVAMTVAPFTPIGCGYFVTVIRPGSAARELIGGMWYEASSSPSWVVEGSVPWDSGRVAPSRLSVIFDSCLRPIRPGDLEDETPESIIKEQTCEHQ